MSQQTDQIENRIHFIRGEYVLLDVDLAQLYHTTAQRLALLTRRYRERLPEDFAFQLTRAETSVLRAQSNTLLLDPDPRRRPWAFTEHGVALLAGVLRSRSAIDANVHILRAFLRVRQPAISHQELAERCMTQPEILQRHDDQMQTLRDMLRKLSSDDYRVARQRGGRTSGRL